MTFKRYFLVGLALLLIAALPVAALAQADATYTADDESFEFDYPGDWDQGMYDDGSVNVYSEDLGVEVYVYGPTLLDELGYDLALPLEDLLEEFLSAYGDSVIPDPAGAREIDLDTGPAYRLRFDTDSDSSYHSAVIGVALHANELPVVVEYYVQDTANEQYAEAIAASLRVPGDVLVGIGDGPGVETLSSYDGTWEAAIRELLELDIIPNGGGLIFTEDYAFFTGQGNFYTPLARTVSEQDVVMAAELSYTSSGMDDNEACTLGARVVWNSGGGTSNYLDVGLLGMGMPFYLDYRDGDTDFDTASMDVDLDEPHHFLLILLDDALTLYVDGELVFEDMPVEARAGSFGVGLNGMGAGAKCEARDIWAYRIDAD